MKIKKHIIKIIILLITSTASASCTLQNSLACSQKKIPADNQSSAKIILKKTIFNQDDEITGPSGDLNSIRIINKQKDDSNEIIYFKSTYKPGIVKFITKTGLELKIEFYHTHSDVDNDGFPDIAELNTQDDRNAFKDWFVRIAESQFLKKNYSWTPETRDCAGLVRFAYKEALKKHNENWHRKSGIVIDKNLKDVKKFNYPKVPAIGKKIYKIKNSKATDLNSFGSFADAETLLKYNVKYISKNILNAEKGDILFFNDMYNRDFPYHTMIVSERTNYDVILIYHTGSNDTIKRVNISYLEKSKKFAPSESNNNFLGIYRFHILE